MGHHEKISDQIIDEFLILDDYRGFIIHMTILEFLIEFEN